MFGYLTKIQQSSVGLRCVGVYLNEDVAKIVVHYIKSAERHVVTTDRSAGVLEYIKMTN